MNNNYRNVFLKRSSNKTKINKWAMDAFNASNLKNLYMQITVNAAQLLRSSLCVLLTIEGDFLVVEASHGTKALHIETQKIPLYSSFSGKLARRGEPCIIKDITQHTEYTAHHNEEYYRGTFISTPLVFNKKEIGIINLCRYNPRKPFSREELEQLITFGSQAAFAITSQKIVEKRTKELQKTQHELLIANEKLKRLDSLKNDFIANITHDFRSPLTAILNIADLAIKYNTSLTPDIHKKFSIIYNASLKLKDTIDKLLNLAKMDAHGLELKIHKVQLVSFIAELVAFYRATITDTKLTISFTQPDKEIENIYTDSDKLEEVLSNIMSNAIKFVDTHNGEIKIDVQDEENSVRILVSDNGIGIAPDKLETIFNRFEQIGTSRQSFSSGTGIGLSYARQLVQLLKGSIRAESTGLGNGSTFIIELPKGNNFFNKEDYCKGGFTYFNKESRRETIRSELWHALQVDDHVGVQIDNANTANEYNIKKGVILIADDNKSILDIVLQYLRNNGYMNFITVTNGKSALQAILKYHPDLIISDINMPDMKGDQLHDAIMSNPELNQIPFIFLSAITDRATIEKSKLKGAVAFLTKPIEEEALSQSTAISLANYFSKKSPSF